MEVMFKCERLGSFYMYCGHIGHEMCSCLVFLDDTLKGEQKEEILGMWIKAKKVGRLLDDRKEIDGE